MIGVRKLVLSFGLALATAGVLPVAAASSQTYNDYVFGIETAAAGPSGVTTCSTNPALDQAASFSGQAFGGLPGPWSAVVLHTDLSSRNAMVCPGGNFTLASKINNVPVVITGSFGPGTITGSSEGDVDCPGTQTFQVTAPITGFASNGAQVKGIFTVTLTHYLGFNCQPFFATVNGPVTLTLTSLL